MTSKEMLSLLMESIKGERAKDTVASIADYHRVQASPGFREAAEYVVQTLQQSEMDDLQILQFPADGKTTYYQWEAPIAWRVKSGSLHLLEPEEMLLGDFDDVPLYVSTHSQKADCVAEVVDVGPGNKPEDYVGKDVKGKIVMATTGARGAHTQAIEHGAVGVIAYPSSQRAAGYPDMMLYDGIWPNSITRESVTFGMSISRRQADQLLAYLDQGKTVKVHAKMDAELYDGSMDVVEAFLQSPTGTNQEILLIAHLCHPKPSANDNASGAGLLVELMRTLSSLLKEQLRKIWKYNIRALWVPEFHGTAAYLQRFEKAVQTHVMYTLNLDMVGESPDMIGQPLHIVQAAKSTPSIVNDVIRFACEYVKDHPASLAPRGSRRPMNIRYGRFTGGSDHTMFTNGWFGKPSVMFGHGDFFHHTTLDTMDKVDSSELKRVGIIAGLATLVLACPNKQSASELVSMGMEGSMNRLTEVSVHQLELAVSQKPLFPDSPAPSDQLKLFKRQLELVLHNEWKMWEDVSHIFEGYNIPLDTIRAALTSQCEGFVHSIETTLGMEDADDWVDNQLAAWDKMVYVRKYHGLLNSFWMYQGIAEDIKELCAQCWENTFGMGQEEFYNLLNGSFSILDIILQLEMEYGFTNLKALPGFLQIWENDLHIIELKKE